MNSENQNPVEDTNVMTKNSFSPKYWLILSIISVLIIAFWLLNDSLESDADLNNISSFGQSLISPQELQAQFLREENPTEPVITTQEEAQVENSQISSFHVDKTWYSLFTTPSVPAAVQPKPIAPKEESSPPLNITAITMDEEQLLAANSKEYTVQLMASHQLSTIKTFITENNLTTNVRIFHTYHKGQDWYTLTYGIYPSYAQAQQIRSDLPAALTVEAPWIRSIGNVQAAIKKTQT